MPELTSDQWMFALMVAILAVLVVNVGVLAYAVSGGGIGNGATGGGSEYKPHPIVSFLHKEPAMVAGVVGSTAALVAAFGLELSSEQIGAIIAFISIVLGIIVRQSVYSGETVAKSGLAFDPNDGELKRRVK